jgi:hypothetical protein
LCLGIAQQHGHLPHFASGYGDHGNYLRDVREDDSLFGGGCFNAFATLAISKDQPSANAINEPVVLSSCLDPVLMRTQAFTKLVPTMIRKSVYLHEETEWLYDGVLWELKIYAGL